MGRGDKRSKKGKRFRGSYGNARPKAISPKANAQANKEEGGKEEKKEEAVVAEN